MLAVGPPWILEVLKRIGKIVLKTGSPYKAAPTGEVYSIVD